MTKSKTRKILLAIGLFGLLAWLSSSSIITNRIAFELPNTLREGLVIDSNGNIYCGSAMYQRIQMYDSNGNFIRPFNTSIGKGRASCYTFRIVNDELHIYLFLTSAKPQRVDRKIIYKLDGTLIDAQDIPSVEYKGYYVVNSAQDSTGNIYQYKGVLFPRVVKISNSQKDIIIATPIYLWLFQSPFPAFLFLALSIILANRLDGIKIFRKKNVTQNYNTNERM